MAAIDYSQMTAAEKLDLIAELCNSIEADAVPLTPAQAAEIERRLATLDEDSKQSRPAAAVSADLRKRYA
jgi:putative addiction module component (TIGR02574 family)